MSRNTPTPSSSTTPRPDPPYGTGSKKTERHDFPPDRKALEDVYTHDLKRLVAGAELESKLKEALAADATFAQHWAVAVKWSEAKRYEFSDENAARYLLTAVSHAKLGVFKWIRTHW